MIKFENLDFKKIKNNKKINLYESYIKIKRII